MVTQSNKPQVSPNQGATDTTPGTVKLSAQQVLDQLRALQQQLPDIAPLTKEERAMVRRQGKLPAHIVEATISVIDNSDPVQSAIGQPAEDVKQFVSDNADWRSVEDQFRAALKSVSDANLVRNQRASILAARAYLIGQQVARDPNNAELRPHLDQVKRLRALASRRKKTAKPAPQPQPQPQPMTPETPASTATVTSDAVKQ
jgi:hypothetical protein